MEAETKGYKSQASKLFFLGQPLFARASERLSPLVHDGVSMLVIWRKFKQRRKPAQISSGFTLIELMVAVVIIAILSAIAIPSYNEYIKRSRISDGLAPLAQYRLQMEQASQDNGNYGVTTCAVAALTATAYFTFNCVLGVNAQTFTATATGTGAMTGYAYTIDDTGAQKTTTYPGRSGLPVSCWLTRKGDC
jgi:type IV pilus assembly protein PilE